jgi:hypothetical protein
MKLGKNVRELPEVTNVILTSNEILKILIPHMTRVWAYQFLTFGDPWRSGGLMPTSSVCWRLSVTLVNIPAKFHPNPRDATFYSLKTP